MSSQAWIEDCQVICNIWNWHSKAAATIPYTILGSISSDNRKSMPNYIIIFESKQMKEEIVEIVGGQQTHSHNEHKHVVSLTKSEKKRKLRERERKK